MFFEQQASRYCGMTPSFVYMSRLHVFVKCYSHCSGLSRSRSGFTIGVHVVPPMLESDVRSHSHTDELCKRFPALCFTQNSLVQ